MKNLGWDNQRLSPFGLGSMVSITFHHCLNFRKEKVERVTMVEAKDIIQIPVKTRALKSNKYAMQSLHFTYNRMHLKNLRSVFIMCIRKIIMYI